jgi:hypothetical protein
MTEGDKTNKVTQTDIETLKKIEELKTSLDDIMGQLGKLTDILTKETKNAGK